MTVVAICACGHRKNDHSERKRAWLFGGRCLKCACQRWAARGAVQDEPKEEVKP